MVVMAYIAVGANLGKRQAAIRAAIERVGQLPRTRVVAVADLRETDPVGGPAGQGRYLNGALAVETELSAEELLQGLLGIEQGLGRDRSREVRFGPRVIDLDLLLYGEQTVALPGLTVPHPRMHERRFVLEPLAQIAPKAVHPGLGKTIEALLAALGEAEDCESKQ